MNDLPGAPKPTAPSTASPPAAPPAPVASPPVAPRRRRRWILRLLILALLAGGGWYAWKQGWLPGSGASQQQAAAPGGRGGGGRRGIAGPVPVSAATAETRDLPILLDALGTVQAANTITVVPQVSGRLTEIVFQEGQEVKAGDVLVRLDARSYQAALDQAVATRAQHEAQLANARVDLQRYTQLMRNSGTSQQTLDTQRATVAQLEAQVQFDSAAIDAARVQLDYTTIRSPVAGRVGLRLVDIGNFVQTSSTGIVVVTQTRPISVTFTLPQQQLPQVLEAIGEGPVSVMARIADSAAPRPDGNPHPADPSGTLVTVDNQVDQTTGTIKLKATFANDDQRLWPGAFVNVRMRVATLRGVVVVPLVAVQRGPDGPFAFVVKEDNTVEQRPLTLGTIAGTDAVVRNGIRPGERVVTSGALRLQGGSAVQVAEPVHPPAPVPGEGPRRRRQGGQQGAGAGQHRGERQAHEAAPAPEGPSSPAPAAPGTAAPAAGAAPAR
ncbi:MAG TPA: efflux RND transporter periplasmic adaptor subunit [Roseomonas sp.]|jgi:multidrug efflux system membrane fusion protein